MKISHYFCLLKRTSCLHLRCSVLGGRELAAHVLKREGLHDWEDLPLLLLEESRLHKGHPLLMGIKLAARVVVPVGVGIQWRRCSRFEMENPLENEMNEFVSQFSLFKAKVKCSLAGSSQQ